MNKIIEFLQGYLDSENISDNLIEKGKLDKSFNTLNKVLALPEAKEKNVFQLKSNPVIRKGQIWLCKQEYYDVFGNEIIGNHPYLVYVVSDIDKLTDESFVRVQPISPFIEFKADDDILIDDNSITGFEFIIETWNEQPVLAYLLDKYVGKVDVESTDTETVSLNLSKVQKEFRKMEIRNTGYLRQSVKSLIHYQELYYDKTVLLNYENIIIEPLLNKKTEENINIFSEPEPIYKSDTNRAGMKYKPIYDFEANVEGVKIKIRVIKEGEKYVLSVKHPENVEVKNNEGKSIKYVIPNFYDGLASGLHFIRINDVKNEIRLRLK